MKPNKYVLVEAFGVELLFDSMPAAIKAMEVLGKARPVERTYPNGYGGNITWRDLPEDHYKRRTLSMSAGHRYEPGEKPLECEIVERPSRPLSKAARKYIAELESETQRALMP